MMAQNVTINLMDLDGPVLLDLARRDIISLRDAAAATLKLTGWNDDEVAVVTLPGAKRRMINGHRKPTVDDTEFRALWLNHDLLLSDITKQTGQSDETMRRRAKNLGLGARTRGRKQNGG